ncbi:MAG: CHAT domain-containing protein [Gammaproteobacteria bacterium]|nr:CHAT domain-containing protein [Gammaproteobacteria bacterium]
MSPSRTAKSAEAFVGVADCHQASGDALRALDALHSALELAGGEQDDGSLTITILGRLGHSYAALGDYRNALDSLSRGIDAAARRGRSAEAAPLLNDLGRMYMAAEQPIQGLAAFADAERLAAGADELRLTAAINLERARAEVGAGGDRRTLDRLAGEARNLAPSRSKAALLLGLAELYGEAAPRAAAPQRLHRRARDVATAALALAARLDDPALLSRAYAQLGASYAAAGAATEALTATRHAVLVAQADAADGGLYRWEWQTARLLRAAGEDTAALAAFRAAIDSLENTQASLVASRRGFRNGVLPLYEQYADVMLERTARLAGPERERSLREVQSTLEKLRIAEVRNYFENQCTVPDAADAANVQPADSVVVYPVLFDDRAELLVSTGDRLFQFTVDVGLAELTHEIGMLRASIEDAAAGETYREHAERVYDWLIRPLEPVLNDVRDPTLVMVPDGPLRTIPLAVLHDGDRFLIERYAIGTTPGLSLIGAVNTEPVTRVLLNGIVAPVRGFPGLPFVAEELDNISNILPSTVLEDEAFVTATLQTEILDGGYSIVHMATHARFESDYRRSFLLAYDDLITLDQLEDYMGSQRYTDRPVDLLVLSACQTAAGDERAALGLAGVAVKAGARSALASLWFINDESTAQLVSEFYRQLADPANGKADALRGAQLLLMNDPRHRHPAYWAPFLMIGDWR